jgi:SSS family solute:Na+ symporter
MFLMGFFWKRSNSAGALATTLCSIPASAVLKYMAPSIPFLNRMSIVFIFCVAIIILFALLDPRSKNNPIALEVESKLFKVSTPFLIGTAFVLGITAALYIVFW